MRWLAAVGRASIWHPNAIPTIEKKYASPLKRVLFPLYDVAAIFLGLFGLLAGFRAIREALPEGAAITLYGVLVAAGVVCLFGCSFPRMWIPEILGKIAILSALGVIVVSMVVAAVNIDGYTGVTVIPVMVVMMMPPLLRLWILGVELASRHSREAAWSG